MKAGKYHMIKSNLFFPLFFTGISLFFSGTLTATSNEDDLSSLLSPEERALVEKELEKQSQKEETSQKKADLDEKSSNPYASLLEENGVKTQQDKPNSAIKRPKKEGSSYSSPENYKRYTPGNRRPADALKSTPSQRSFGS